jgi:hypothetical protein
VLAIDCEYKENEKKNELIWWMMPQKCWKHLELKCKDLW